MIIIKEHERKKAAVEKFSNLTHFYNNIFKIMEISKNIISEKDYMCKKGAA